MQPRGQHALASGVYDRQCVQRNHHSDYTSLEEVPCLACAQDSGVLVVEGSRSQCSRVRAQNSFKTNPSAAYL